MFLAEARQDFKDSCSVQVYSFKACVPNDTTVLWNHEFVQAEKLFNQPFHEEKCLRDNRGIILLAPLVLFQSQVDITR